jgi:hypothetical protein
MLATVAIAAILGTLPLPYRPSAASTELYSAGVAVSGSLAQEPGRLVLFEDTSRLRLPLEADGGTAAVLQSLVGRRVAVRGLLLPHGALRVLDLRLLPSTTRR